VLTAWIPNSSYMANKDLDQTGRSGSYYFALEFAREDLGLRLEKHKGPVEMLVVDHIEKTPTEN
jgi:hypothetical protein